MALSRRELNAARRGKRGTREQFRAVSNAEVAQPGQPRGDAAEHGSVLAGISQDTGMRASERPKRNTNSRRFMTSFRPGPTAGFDLRNYRGEQDYEMWTPNKPDGGDDKPEPRKRAAVRVVDNAREVTPVVIRMGEFE